MKKFFAEITRERNRRGAFASVAELDAAIRDDLLDHSAYSPPFVCMKSAAGILNRERPAFNVPDALRGNQVSESER